MQSSLKAFALCMLLSHTKSIRYHVLGTCKLKYLQVQDIVNQNEMCKNRPFNSTIDEKPT